MCVAIAGGISQYTRPRSGFHVAILQVDMAVVMEKVVDVQSLQGCMLMRDRMLMRSQVLMRG